MKLLIEKGYDCISIDIRFNGGELAVGAKTAEICIADYEGNSTCIVNMDVNEEELNILKGLINEADLLMYEEQKKNKEKEVDG